MSRWSAAWIDDSLGGVIGNHKPIIWRHFSRDHPNNSAGWYRLYWGEEELAWILKHPGVSRGWDVIIQAGRNMPANNTIMSDYSGMGKGFATRWLATEYVLKALGIQPKRN